MDDFLEPVSFLRNGNDEFLFWLMRERALLIDFQMSISVALFTWRRESSRKVRDRSSVNKTQTGGTNGRPQAGEVDPCFESDDNRRLVRPAQDGCQKGGSHHKRRESYR